MSTGNSRILFIDGFAGPGEYEGGEEGSPIIALRAYLEHTARARMKNDVGFYFIEKEGDRVAHLNGMVDHLRPQLPANCRVLVEHGEFDETMTEVLNRLDEQARRLAPAFVMVDPFGVKGTPMRVLARILKNPRTELYISFMYDFISRFRASPEFEPHMDELFGSRDWRDGIDMVDPEERRAFFFDLYERQLRGAGARYVLRFDLYSAGRLVYAIFFAMTVQRKQVLVGRGGRMVERRGGQPRISSVHKTVLSCTPVYPAYLRPECRGSWREAPRPPSLLTVLPRGARSGGCPAAGRRWDRS
jgi:three-Cys-motif partner protein